MIERFKRPVSSSYIHLIDKVYHFQCRKIYSKRVLQKDVRGVVVLVRLFLHYHMS